MAGETVGWLDELDGLDASSDEGAAQGDDDNDEDKATEAPLARPTAANTWSNELDLFGCAEEEEEEPEVEEAGSRLLADPSALQIVHDGGYALVHVPGGPTDSADAGSSGGPRDLADQLREARRSPDSALHHETVSVAQHYLSDKLHVGFVRSDAAFAGVSPAALRRLRAATAEACFRYEREGWRRLEARLVEGQQQGQIRLLFYMEFMAYDGVDFHLKTTGQFMAEGVVADERLCASGAQGDVLPPVAKRRLVDTVGTTKVLNAETIVSIVAEIGGQYVTMHGVVDTILSACDRMTAETMRRALTDYRVSMEHSGQFPRRLRVAVTDSATVNFKVEKFMMRDLPGWEHLHIRCNLHRLSSVHTRTFDLVQHEVSGMIAVAKSLGDAGLMGRFRKSMLAVISKNLRFFSGELSEAAKSYRRVVLDTFVGTSPMVMGTRMLISRLAGGDWRQPHVFEFRADGDGEHSREHALALIEEHLMPLLAGRCPSTFPRSRWTGMDQSLADIGLASCLHGLFEESYTHFVQANWPRSAAAAVSAGAAQRGDAERTAAAEEQVGEAHGAAQWAAENRANRLGAARWLCTNPGPMCLALRIVLEPMMAFLKAELDLSSGCWQTLQASKMTHLPAGLTVRELMASRDWPLLVAAGGSLEHRFAQDLRDAHSSSRWDAFPVGNITMSFIHLVFKLLSRQGAACHELVIAPRTRFPFRLFLLLTKSESELQLSKTCASSRDAYSASFLQHHEGQLDSKEALLELACVAQIGRTSIVRLESLNATIRRHLAAAAVQCKTPTFPFISAEFYLGKLRRRLRALRIPPGSRGHRSRVLNCKAKRREAGGRGRRGGGGAWRAYISSEARGLGLVDFHELAASYTSMTDDDKEHYADLGTTATIIHRAGGKAFGEKPRGIARLSSRAARRARALENLAKGVVPDNDLATAWAMPLDDVVSSARQADVDARVARRVLRERAEAAAQQVVQYRNAKGIRARDAFAIRLLGIAVEVPALFAEAGAAATDVLLNYCPHFDKEIPRLLGLSQKCHPFVNHLQKEWDDRHHLYLHANQEQLVDEDAGCIATDAQPSCLEAGICLCHGQGAAIWKLRCVVSNVLKTKFRANSRFRHLLDNGDIVLRLRGVAEIDLGESEFEEVRAQGGWREDEYVDEFAHVSLMYWKLVRPTLRMFEAIYDDAPEDRIILTAQHKYETLTEFAARVYNEEVDTWNLTVYRLLESPRPMLRMDPRKVVVEEIVAIGATECRLVPCQRLRIVGWVAVLDQLGGDIDDNDNDDSQSDPGPGNEDDVIEELFDQQSQRSDLEPPDEEANVCSEVSMHDEGLPPPPPGLEEVNEAMPAVEGRPMVDDPSSSSSSSSSASSSSSEDGTDDVARQREPQASSSSSALAVAPSLGAAAAAAAPPAQPEAKAKARAGRAKHADIEVHLQYGVLRYYNATRQCVAHCTFHGEKVCRLTRTFKERPSCPQQGRPMGHLLAWLQVGILFESAAEHVHMMPPPDYTSRAAARAEAEVQGHPGLRALMGSERPPRHDEGPEPERAP